MTQGIQLYHSTSWPGLEQILATDELMPGQFSREDLTAEAMQILNEAGVKPIWLSTQYWSQSRFGPYVFALDSEIVLPRWLVPLPDHHGARCYLAIDPPARELIAKALKREVVDRENDTSWTPQRNERVDIIFAFPVPIGPKISFTSGVAMGTSIITASPHGAKARFAAKMLLEGRHTYDAELEPAAETMALLLRELSGRYEHELAKAHKEALAKPINGSSAEFLTAGLLCVEADDASLAARAVAYVGTLTDVADELALKASGHFNTPVTGTEIIERMI